MLKKIMSCLLAGLILVCSGILGVSAEEVEETIQKQNISPYTTWKHTTTLCGYAFSNSTEIVKIMNPGPPNYQFINKSSSGCILHYNGYTLNWDETIKIN